MKVKDLLNIVKIETVGKITDWNGNTYRLNGRDLIPYLDEEISSIAPAGNTIVIILATYGYDL